MSDFTKAAPRTSRTDGDEPRARWGHFDASWISRYGVYIALVALVIVNLVITDNFLSSSSLKLQLVQTVPVTVVALGMALVIGTGGIDLSVGAVMAISAAVLPLYFGYTLVIAIVIALLTGVVIGALAGSVVAYLKVQPIVVTLAVLVGGRGAATLIGGEIKTIREPGMIEIGSGTVLGIPFLVLIAVALTAIVWFVVRRSTYGRQLVAIGGNPTAARLAGLPVARVLITTYVICSVLAALAGVLYVARFESSDPTQVGMLIELYAITAVVIGGTSLSGGQVRVVGTVAGALLMQLLDNTLTANNIEESISKMVSALIVLLAVYVQVGRSGSTK